MKYVIKLIIEFTFSNIEFKLEIVFSISKIVKLGYFLTNSF